MGMEDDLVYLKILLFSFAASFVVKRCPKRDVFSGLVGFLLVLFVCRVQLLYSLIVVLINLAIINLINNNRRTDLLSFGFCFSYVTFFRCAHLLNLPKALPYANAIQLIMTLRVHEVLQKFSLSSFPSLLLSWEMFQCVGLAFEMHDAKLSVKKKDDNITRDTVLLETSVLEQFFYCYNFVGLFTGPYFSFRVHLDNIRCPYLLNINYANHLTPRLLLVPCFIVLLLIAESLFPLNVLHDDKFYENNGFFFRLLYMVPVFFHLRMRCYTAWTLSEMACIVAGIGAYPVECKPKCGQGPTDFDAFRGFATKSKDDMNEVDFSFETIRNVDPAGCEFAGTFRVAMRYWNQSVQYWLATYIYRRTPKAYRTAITMLVSAYWHGVHPGYYLSFLTIPICLYVEDLMFSYFGPNEDDEKHHVRKHSWDSKLATTFEKIWWFFRVRGFEYMAMGFLLLSWTSTIKYWRSIGFALHLALLILFTVTLIMKMCGCSKRKRSSRKNE